MTERQKFDPIKSREKIARTISRIVELYVELHWQMMAATNDHDFPGGRALNMLAGATVAQDWQRVYEYLERQGASDLDKYADAQTAEDEHPINVLGFWTRVIREERDQPTSLQPTVAREADYLRKNLDWMIRIDEFGDPEWFEVTELERDLTTLRRRMEDVLFMGKRADLVRARCMYCDKAPRLARRYNDQAAADRWVCPACDHAYDQDAVHRARHHQLASEGAEKFVGLHDARDVAGVDRRTWWSWQERLKMRTACEIKTRKVIVWWPDVRDLVRDRDARKAKTRSA